MDDLRYDYSFMLDSAVGPRGISSSVISGFTHTLVGIRHEKFSSPSDTYGFMKLPFLHDSIQAIAQLAGEIQSRYSTLLVLGIGGSDLGARAVYCALSPCSAMRLVFLGANTDPVEIERVLSDIDWSSTAVNIISKSGDTIEPMSVFLLVRARLIEAVGIEIYSQHIIATTDARHGTLRYIAEREGYRTLVVPDDVGGRFSVLSSVGLFPLACAGVSIDQLCAGAASLIHQLRETSSDVLHSTELFALLHYIGYTQFHYHIHVFIPYSTQLYELGFWFRQLWAESLGKRETLSGEQVFVGPTPIAAIGATDQHSQFQLYYFGPFDKIITFVDVLDYGCDLAVPFGFEDIDGVSYMQGLSYAEILRTELKASSLALVERERVNGRLILPSITPYSVGQLIQFLEIATVYTGLLFSINPFDQPGVELGKQNMYALFHRSGFDERRLALNTYLKHYEKYVI